MKITTMCYNYLYIYDHNTIKFIYQCMFFLFNFITLFVLLQNILFLYAWLISCSYLLIHYLSSTQLYYLLFFIILSVSNL